jgi:type VI secretion system secreted protein VgrG
VGREVQRRRGGSNRAAFRAGLHNGGNPDYDYGGSKPIRVAQPSGGMSDGEAYGMHFPSKQGAEMVPAYVDGNPDRPLGLGFVPNMASPSVINNLNSIENVMRSWSGNKPVMTDKTCVTVDA